ncbi:MAG TPA: hypothetical protein VHT30_10385 [Acidimicrobiales bacterium]|jgi:hypothetical protein|nr:hypothetical protein [Acidimicrobiales bacterium]
MRSAGTRRRWILVGLAASMAGFGVTSVSPANAAPADPATVATATSPGGCSLGSAGAIQHVIYIQFDNTHFTRDNPNVPSDIEQIPALYNFIEGNGTVLDNDHTPLIAHTADDLVTSLTGEYGNNQGIPEANSYQYYKPNGKTDTAGSFGYWTDPVDSYSTTNGLGPDRTPNMIDQAGAMAPAPWVPYTRAGCDVGDVAMANTELENAVPDVPLVFGQNSPEAAEARNPNAPTATDFEGLSVHCARASSFCAANSRPVPDRLPDEPGGYHGYQAVFGAKYLDSELSPNGPLTNLDGSVITDSNGVAGFPGYNGMQPVNALAYTLDMQEKGIPVTYTYVTDAHDDAVSGNGMGPGEATYEAQLQAYNQAFTTFFQELANNGITKANTLFVFGEDENDHYVGSSPTPPNCNGVVTPCSYSQLGEVDANLQGLLATETGVTTPFAVHSDSAPFIYLNGQPAPSDPTVRTFGRAVASLTAVDPYKSKTVPLTNYLADPAELQVLHMVTADPARTPTLAMFANPDFYLYTGGASCSTPNCESFDTEVWNHGDLSPDINTSWMAFVGPGVRSLGTDRLWASETDTRPTLMTLLGLKDDYTHEGRVLTEILDPASLAPSLQGPVYRQLGAAYTALESPVGPFGVATLALSTAGIASGSATNDAYYARTEKTITQLGAERDQLTDHMIALLEGAAYAGQAIPVAQAEQLIAQEIVLLSRAEVLAQEAAGH